MGNETTVTGPVQMLVIGFDGDHFTGEILRELRRLKDEHLVRVIDLLFVRKGESGEIDVLQMSDLSHEEAQQYGAIVGALVGLDAASGDDPADALDDSDFWEVADVLPPGRAAAIALLEHRWAVPLRDAIVRAGGHTLADEWIHASDLLAAGVQLAEGAGASA
jgi:uncharacterized protein DUF6325